MELKTNHRRPTYPNDPANSQTLAARTRRARAQASPWAPIRTRSVTRASQRGRRWRAAAHNTDARGVGEAPRLLRDCVNRPLLRAAGAKGRNTIKATMLTDVCFVRALS